MGKEEAIRGLGKEDEVVLTMQTEAKSLENSLAIQWLRLRTFTAVGPGFDPQLRN